MLSMHMSEKKIVAYLLNILRALTKKKERKIGKKDRVSHFRRTSFVIQCPWII